MNQSHLSVRTAMLAAVLLTGSLALAGCSGATTTGSGAKPVAADAKAVISHLPAALKSQYVAATSNVEVSPYADFKKIEGPWKVCFSDSFEGNSWRVAVKNELSRLSEQYKKDKLVSSFEVAVSENDVARQNQQIRQFTSQKCSVIIVIAGSSTGLNQAIQASKAAGIPVVTIAGSVTSAAAVNVDSNYNVMGRDLAKAVSEKSKNVLMVKGIEGNPVAVQQNQGAKQEWAKTGTTIASEVNGNWTPSVTKSAVLTALTTSAAPVGAVWSTGSETSIIAQAFKDSGKPAPLITGSITGDALGFWKANPDYFKFDGVALTPSWTAQTGFNIAMRILQGNGPKLSTMMVPIPRVTEADLPALYESCMTVDAASVFPVVKADPLPSDLMDSYFKTAGNVGPFQYSQTPDPCS
ncbi:substrate-binding domain-containing protein [Glaciihabitans sp. UYNi722]|uniref:substrate-binding domain-containing protein n=1 Tax=Glaciihabitans sp. UYNi722 TaxID=3156344 RepID=UPI00339608CD